jgi:hypothetical protein
MRRITIALTIGLLAGCASIEATPVAPPLLKAGHSVELQAEARTDVGGTMLSEFSYSVKKNVVTTAPFERSILLAKVSIPDELPLMPARVDGKEGYCTPRATFFNIGEARSTCLFDTRGTGVFDQLYVVGSLAGMTYDVNVPYRAVETIVGNDGFKYELLYQGRDRDALRISYREFTGNLARPAYQQDLVYTLERPGPTAISFRGVRMEILSADNNEVRYRVLSWFNK